MKVPDIRTKEVILVDAFDRRYDTGSIRTYEYLIDKFSLNVRIMARSYDGETLVFDINDVEHFSEVINQAQDRSPELSLVKGNLSKSRPDQNTPTLSLHNEAEGFQVTLQDNEDEEPDLDE